MTLGTLSELQPFIIPSDTGLIIASYLVKADLLQRIILFCFLSISLLKSNGQNLPYEDFHIGTIQTKSGEAISGKIKFDIQANRVFFVDEQLVRDYGSHQIVSFHVKDSFSGAYRYFHSLNHSMRGLLVPSLFESHEEGTLSVLTRHKIVDLYHSYGSRVRGGTTRPVATVLRYTLYVSDLDGNIMRIKKRKDLMDFIEAEHKDQVKTFIKLNKLKAYHLRDLVNIVAFYNSIENGETVNSGNK